MTDGRSVSRQGVSLLSSYIACLIAIFPLSTSARRRVFAVSGLALALPVHNMRLPVRIHGAGYRGCLSARYGIVYIPKATYPQLSIIALVA